MLKAVSATVFSVVFSVLIAVSAGAQTPPAAAPAAPPAAAPQPVQTAAAPAPQVQAPAPAAKPVTPAADVAPQTPPEWFILTTIFLVYLSVLGAFLMVRNNLRADPIWKLGDALAEEGEVTENGTKITKLLPSTSRLIAFFGLIVLMFLFLGFGIFTLYFFAVGQDIKSMDSIIKFLLSGLALFAPYAVNQVRAAMESLSASGK